MRAFVDVHEGYLGVEINKRQVVSMLSVKS